MILIVVLVVIALYIWSLYNKLVTTKARIKASIQEIGNQLKRQAEYIPNIIASANKYLKHEKDIFKGLTDARKSIMEAVKSNDPQKMVDAAGEFQKHFGKLSVLVENTPELKGVEVVTKQMDELRDTADKLMYSRRVLIDLTADYNIMVVTFPANLVAKLLGFTEEKGLVMPEEGSFREVSEEEMKTPKVD